ncbi:MAG: HpsJ family protein [Leptolyngbya sp. Prado105]|jgi:outer membrane murein-binding lipoprotein Lpp|nr:HpsJ family protein [Leptolyngbya sp. Prado105]
MTFTSKKIVGSSLIDSPRAKKLCRIVGLACLVAFAVDFFVIVLPPDFGAAQWRLSSLQQVGDRSIVVLFGLALLMYGVERRKILRSLALLCFTIGTVFVLSCAVVAQDSLALQRQANEQISAQVSQLNSRLQAIQENPEAGAKITPEQLTQAAQRVNAQAESAKQNANNSILKSGILSIGNLAVIGVTLLVLGRYSLYLFRA